MTLGYEDFWWIFLRSYAFDKIGIFAHNYQQLVLLQANEELDQKDVI